MAQDCSESYGRSILVQRICCDAAGQFSFEDVSEILPRGLQYGVHTFNVSGDWAVVDANVADYPLIRHLWFGLAKWVRK
ncbi:MAG: hypothetical protein J6Y32_06220 [Bacteroidales bacterium]|nr:hypothetical protein [Bacteroidales bacterium]